MAAAIEYRDISLEVGDGRAVLTGITLTVCDGDTVALLGHSGSGKTTLLRMVNGLVAPTNGEVIVRGVSLSSVLRSRAQLIALRRSIGYVIQETGLFPHMNVARNAGMVLELEGRPQNEIEVRVRELLRSTGLDPAEYAARYPYQLSGGQRQRVGLARALAASPSLLLMDEPFGALDPLTRVEMQRMLRGLLLRSGLTVLMVTHDLDEALYLADRIVLLEAGRIVADLPAAEFAGSANPAVRAYVRAVRHVPDDSGGLA